MEGVLVGCFVRSGTRDDMSQAAIAGKDHRPSLTIGKTFPSGEMLADFITEQDGLWVVAEEGVGDGRRVIWYQRIG